jgi:methionyl-tRNA synthetase
VQDAELIGLASALRVRYEEQMEKFAFQGALAEIFKVISRANKYIDETAPWVLAKDEALRPRLARVMYNLLESIRVCSVLLLPFIPQSCEKIFAQLGADGAITTWESAQQWGLLPAAAVVNKSENLFPRIDMAKELADLEATQAPAEPEVPTKDPVTIDEFDKLDLTVCKVLSCENVPKSEKLLKFQLDDGTGKTRQILSGIAKFYKAEELVGKTIVAITNLPPRKMMGQESNGMIISAEKDDVLNLLMLDDGIPAGAKLC